MHAITDSPPDTATLVLSATSSEFSPAMPKPSRRSLWPTMTHDAPMSFSMAALVSPVRAPFGKRLTFCPPTATSFRMVPDTIGTCKNGGATMTSTLAGMGPHLPRVPTSLSTDSTSPLHFQFPPKMSATRRGGKGAGERSTAIAPTRAPRRVRLRPCTRPRARPWVLSAGRGKRACGTATTTAARPGGLRAGVAGTAGVGDG